MPIPPYPPVPNPSTYVNGPVLVSELTSDMTNGVLFLSNRPVFEGYSADGASIPANTPEAVTIDVENIDTWAGHGSLFDSPNYYCQAPGWYLVEGFAPWAYTPSTQVVLQASIGYSLAGGTATSGGQEQICGSTHDPAQFAADLILMTRTGTVGAANADFVYLSVSTAGTGVTLANSSAGYPRLQCRWMGTGSASSLSVPANASFPVPPGSVDATWLNTNISDAVGFLSNPPMLRYSYTPGAATLASSTWPTGSAVSLNTIGLDNFGGASGGTYVIPEPGIYYVYAQVGVTNSTSAAGYAAGVSIGGTITWGSLAHASANGFSNSFVSSLTGRFRCYAGQTVTLYGFQNSGGALTITSTSRLILAWESS